jgi:hypothetical protein
MVANTGTTFQSRMVVAPSTTMSITAGYVIAPLIFRTSASFFSRKVARRRRMVSRIPPASPAATMFTYRSVNTLGCWRIASASVCPAWMSLSTWVMMTLNFGVLRLLGQDREALHQRQPRVDHGRELPGEDHHLARLDPRAEAERDLLRLAPHVDRDQPLLAEVPITSSLLGRSSSPDWISPVTLRAL